MEIFKLLSIFSITGIAKFITNDTIYVHLILNYYFISRNLSVLLHVIVIWLYINFYYLDPWIVWIPSIAFYLIYHITTAYRQKSIITFLIYFSFLSMLFYILDLLDIILPNWAVIIKNLFINYALFRIV